MFSKMFTHTDLLAKSLDTAWQRNEVHAQNVANAETPGYKSQRIEFESEFKRALADDTSFEAKRTDPRHIQFGTGDPLDVNPTIVTDTATSMRMDGNNVDIDYEMNEIAKNTIQYNMLITKTNAELKRLKYAAREGR